MDRWIDDTIHRCIDTYNAEGAPVSFYFRVVSCGVLFLLCVCVCNLFLFFHQIRRTFLGATCAP